ncbi:unnamed protein product [Clonostachys solani]|uniref:AB hydrolase-1 domain-containing protein n=1 Tax=Clonostachys solani TaxID=160281 RepID=A0A9P0EIW0_9HYPO|nr:unnamed protein product [Clonostachys solani]
MSFTVIICPGAWPLVSFFEPLIQAFKDRGHAVVCKVRDSYPTFDPMNPPALNPDTDYLRTQVLGPAIETGVDVVVFMHSYGGIYGAEALKGLSKQERAAKGLEGGVIAAILTCAFVGSTGSTALDLHWDPYQDPNFKGKLGFIYTGADRIFPIEAQRQAVSKAEIKHTYLLEDSSHSPHLEQPENLAGLVIDMVRDITGGTKI